MKKTLVLLLICLLMITSTVTVMGNQSILIKTMNRRLVSEKRTASPLENDKWMKTFGGFRIDVGSSIQLTTDGGYILLGITKSFGEGKEDIWLIKTDRTGNMTWNKTFGGSGIDFGNFVQQTADGGYIIVGSTSSYGNGEEDVWLIKTDESGNRLWDKTYGYTLYDSGSEVRQTNDGGYIIVGEKNNSGGGDSDLWVIKTDSNGDMLWDKTFDGEGHPISHDYGNSLTVTSDGSYVVLGATFTTEETNNYDAWLIKINDDGATLWEKRIGSEDTDFGWSVQQTSDEGFIITGVDSYGVSEKLWLVKTDSSGNVMWEETYSGEKKARGSSVEQTSDGGYIIAGYTFTESSDYNVLLIKTDDVGIQEWSKTFGGSYNDIAVSVRQTADGGYILIGEKGSAFHDEDVWVIKTDENGVTQVKINSSISTPLFITHFLTGDTIWQRVMDYILRMIQGGDT